LDAALNTAPARPAPKNGALTAPAKND